MVPPYSRMNVNGPLYRLKIKRTAQLVMYRLTIAQIDYLRQFNAMLLRLWREQQDDNNNFSVKQFCS